jgi:hypothetical protein
VRYRPQDVIAHVERNLHHLPSHGAQDRGRK